MASWVSMPAGCSLGACCSLQSSGASSCSVSMQVPYPFRAIGTIPIGRCKSFPSKQSSFLPGVALHRDLLLLVNLQLLKEVPARSCVSRIVSSRKRSSYSDLCTASDARVVQKSRKARWDGQKALVVTEGVCIVVAGASYSLSVFNKQHTTPVVSSSSAGEHRVLPRYDDPSTWCVPALWVALVINACLRTWQRRPSSKWEERNIQDFTLDQRVGKLEEGLEGMTTTSRSLSRHLEKLGVRFRATKRNLRDPVQETIELVKRTSAIVRDLAGREEILEMELSNTQQGLITVQDVLAVGSSRGGYPDPEGDQEQQMKQLELLKAGLAKSLKSQQAVEDRIMKALHKETPQQPKSLAEQARPPHSSNGEALPKRPFMGLMDEIKSFWKSKASKDSSTGASTSSKQKSATSDFTQSHSSKEIPLSDVQRNFPGAAGDGTESQSSVYSPDTRSRDEDYWASPTPAFEGPSASSEAPVESLAATSLDGKDGGGPNAPEKVNSDHKATSARLDSFFSSRKGSNSSQGEAIPVTQSTDSSNARPSTSQSGERNSNGSTPH